MNDLMLVAHILLGPFFDLCYKCGRRGGLMVSALVPKASGPGSSPNRGQCVVLLGKAYLTVSLSTQEFKWLTKNC